MSSDKFGLGEWSEGDIPTPFEDDESDALVWTSDELPSDSEAPEPFQFCCDDSQADGEKAA